MLEHRRSSDILVFVRKDGLRQVDAQFIDVMTRGADMADGLRPAGTPINDLGRQPGVDAGFQVLDAGASSTWAPSARRCDDNGDAYVGRIGLTVGNEAIDAVWAGPRHPAAVTYCPPSCAALRRRGCSNRLFVLVPSARRHQHQAQFARRRRLRAALTRA